MYISNTTANRKQRNCFSALLLFLFWILHNTVHSSVIEWTGGSASWNSTESWGSGSIPGEADAATLAGLLPNQTVTVDVDTVVGSLVLTAGVLKIEVDITLQVGSMSLLGGEVQGPGTLILTGTSEIANSTTVVLGGRTTLENYGALTWLEGDLAFSNASVLKNYGQFFINGTDDSLRYSTSWYEYSKTAESVLNDEVNLTLVMPESGSVYDMMVGSAVRVNHRGELFELHALTNDEAANFYAKAGFDYDPAMYSSQNISAMTAEACAGFCSSSLRCQSFDFNVDQSACYLSPYLSKQVGGLSSNKSGWSHYESDDSDLPDPLFVNENSIVVSRFSSNTITIPFLHQGEIRLEPFSSFVLSGDGTMQNCSCMIEANAQLNITQPKIEMKNGTLLQGEGVINFLSGSHFLPENIEASLLSLHMQGTATVYHERTGVYQLSSLIIEEDATFNCEDLALKVPTLTAHGAVSGESLTIVTENLMVPESGVLSVSGGGHASDIGPGAGLSGVKGGSGGGHGGEGGNGYTASGVGTEYGDYRSPTEFGSGGGNSSYGHGGRGGGSLIINATATVMVNGAVRANGKEGSYKGGGGGAGGSVQITTPTMLGNGSLSANGGKGGYPGGWISGGGGSGGRMAIYASLDGFNGSVTACGGSQHTQVMHDAVYAAAGTVFLEDLEGRTTLDIDNCGQGDGAWTTLNSSTITLDEINILREGNLKVTGSVEASVVNGDGKSLLQVEDGAHFSFSNTVATIEEMEVVLKSGAQWSGFENVEIKDGGILRLYSESRTQGHPRSVHQIPGNLTIHDGGQLIFEDSNIFLSAEFMHLKSGSTVSVVNSATIEAGTGFFTSNTVKGGNMTLSSNGSYLLSGSISFDGLKLVNAGNGLIFSETQLTFSNGAKITNLGQIEVAQNSETICEGGYATVVNEEGGQISLREEAQLETSSFFTSDGVISMGVSSLIKVHNGGKLGPTSTWNLSSNSSVEFWGGEVRMSSTSRIFGQGSLYFKNASVSLPSTVDSNLFLKVEGGSVYGGSYISAITVSAGKLSPSNLTTLNISDITITESGALDVSGGRELILSSMCIWENGYLQGNGTIQNNANMMLGESGSAVDLYLKDEVTLLNTGTMQWRGGNIISVQSAKFINQRLFNISTSNASWGPGGPLSNFTRYAGYELSSWPPVATYESTTLKECAVLCNEGNMPFSAPRPLQSAQAIPQEQCRSFDYNPDTQVCHLNIYRATTAYSMSNSYAETAWSYYEKKSSWVSPLPVVRNEAGAKMCLESGLKVNVSIEFINEGFLNVHAGATFNIYEGGSSSDTATFSISANAQLAVVGDSFEMSSSTVLEGSGEVSLSGGNVHTLPDSISASELSLAITGGASVSDNGASGSGVSYEIYALDISEQSTMNLENGGSLQIESLTLFGTSTAVLSEAFYLRSTDIYLGSYSTLYVENMVAELNTVLLRENGQFFLSRGNMTAVNMTIQNTAVAGCTGQGYSCGLGEGAGTSHSFGGGGAGHGGQGGGGDQLEGEGGGAYGHLYWPEAWGSGGGGSGYEEGGAGGGQLNLDVQNLTVNGVLGCSGQSASSYAGGGGSGGSLWVTATNLEGTGSIEAVGGDGYGTSKYSRGGGGSGGRIALYLENDEFSGSISVKGGTGYQNGASGTIYKQVTVDGAVSKQHIIVDNSGIDTEAHTAIFQTTSEFYGKIDTVTIDGSAIVHFEGESFALETLTGDGSGTLLLQTGTNLSLPSSFTLGPLTLVCRNATISTLSSLEVGPNASLQLYQTSGTDDGGLGDYRWANLTVMSGGTLSIHNSGHDPNDTVVLIVERLIIKDGGRLHADGLGYAGALCSTTVVSAAEGPGAGSSMEGGAGGGAHAAAGGQGYADEDTGGAPAYGSALWPESWGSGGGCTHHAAQGGSGGGLLYIVASQRVIVNGNLTAQGASVTAQGGGGGAGGSIKIQTVEFSGQTTGLVSVDGGDGGYGEVSFGGAGAGGRIAIFYDSINFQGKYSAAGGSVPYFSNDVDDWGAIPNIAGLSLPEWLETDIVSAGAGTVFLEESTGLRELTVDNDRSTGVLANWNQTCSFTTFDEVASLNSLSLLGSANLDLRGANLSVDAIVADGTGSLYLMSDTLLSFPETFTLSDLDVYVNNATVLGAQNLTLDDSSVFLYSASEWTSKYSATSSSSNSTPSNRSSLLYHFDSLNIGTGSHVVVMEEGIKILANSVNVSSGATLHADGRGHPANSGPLPGSTGTALGGGGGHAGSGGDSDGERQGSYGSVKRPTSAGSGGGGTYLGEGSAGGGQIRLVVYDELKVYGRISADGEPCTGALGGGGGAGGSVWISGGGGAGGYVAIYLDYSLFQGYFIAAGAVHKNQSDDGSSEAATPTLGYYITQDPSIKQDTSSSLANAAAGTIYLKNASSDQKLYINNYHILDGTTYIGEDFPNLQKLSIKGGSNLVAKGVNMSISNVLEGDNSTSLTLADGTLLSLPAEFTLSDIKLIVKDAHVVGWEQVEVGSNATLVLYSAGKGYGAFPTVAGPGWYCFQSLHVRNGGLLRAGLMHADAVTNDYANLTVTIDARDIQVDEKGAIDGNGLGYKAVLRRSPANPTNYSGTHSNGIYGGGGGGHAGEGGPGFGGTAGGSVHGSTFLPSNPGGAGGAGVDAKGGDGGSAIHLRANRTLNIDGRLSVNGANPPIGDIGGAGAGGSLYIYSAGSFAGSGLVSAQGGDTWLNQTHSNDTLVKYGGAGSGGRIAVQANSYEFSGTYNVKGGEHLEEKKLSDEEEPTIWETPLTYLYEQGSGRKQQLGASGTLLIGKSNSDLNDWASLEINGKVNTSASKTAILDNLQTSQNVTKVKVSDAELEFRGSGPIQVEEVDSPGGDGTVVFAASSVLQLTKTFTITGGATLKLKGIVEESHDIQVEDNSTLYLYPTLNSSEPGALTVNNLAIIDGSQVKGSSINIHAINSISLGPWSQINADALGYSGATPGYSNAQGPGAGGSASTGGSGGGHGGRGLSGAEGKIIDSLGDYSYLNSTISNSIPDTAYAISGGTTYGDVYTPSTWGSGGGSSHTTNGYGGAGGGSIRLKVDGTLQMDWNAAISASGADGLDGGGGGAGGSVWMTCNNLIGMGTVSVTGGSAEGTAGAGGGGRIAIYTANNNYTTSFEAQSGILNEEAHWAHFSRYIGTIYANHSSLISAVEAKNSSAENVTFGPGSTIDIVYGVSRRAPVQVITNHVTKGSFWGNGTFAGAWKIAFKSSSWSEDISAEASADEVKAAIESLGMTNGIGVDRNNNSLGNGWSWSVTFYEDFGNPSLFLLYYEELYSRENATDGKLTAAAMNVSHTQDYGTELIDSPQVLTNLTFQGISKVLEFSHEIVANYTAEWIRPYMMRLTMLSSNNSIGPTPDVFYILQNSHLSNLTGRWFPNPLLQSPLLEGDF